MRSTYDYIQQRGDLFLLFKRYDICEVPVMRQENFIGIIFITYTRERVSKGRSLNFRSLRPRDTAD